MADNTTAHTSVAHTGAEGGHGSFPPFDSATFASQLLWLALAFVLLYWLMSRLALPRIAAIFEARRDRIAADLAEASRLKAEADTAGAAYEKALADARARAQAMAGEARDRLFGETEKSRHALEERLTARLAEADKAIAATRTAAMGQVRGIAVDTAAIIVRRLTGISAPEPAVAKAVDDVLRR
ncbi:F0F1 ATP synthase subunit B [Xanthobacteraceae bacterium Astr-EGSB]|uniref:F0F1 ATP synthase subunit B n=1 Tax=Astrobacterium formosum TaxID=3069710 RepID=UPI0027B47210|nr:F0F1 ATP synthase subunit B [Xanthobacteraceae bacterium Astr-EGSB]